MDAWIEVAPGFAFQQWAQERQRPGWLPDRGQTLVLHAGSHRLVADVVVPQDVELRFEAGAVIVGRVSLTLHGRIVAAEGTIFDVGSGLRVRMVGRRTPQVVPQWWGARAGTVGDGAALVAMAAAIGHDGPSVVRFPAGRYLLDRTVSLPTGKRYLAAAHEDAVILGRHPDLASDAALCLCRNPGDAAASRVSFRGLSFEGDGDAGPLLRMAPTSRRVRFEAVVTGCSFRGAGAAALESQNGANLTVDGCSFADCVVAVSALGASQHVAISRTRTTGEGGNVVLEGGDGSVVTISEVELSGRITVRDHHEGDVRIADSVCEGLDVDAPGGRVGVVNASLLGARVVDGTVVITEARQVILEGCRVALTARGRRAVAVRIRWRSGADGSVLLHGCTLEQTVRQGDGQTAIEVTDSGGDGARRVDVIGSTVGQGFAMAALLSGAHASFRQVALQCDGGFQLQRNVHGGAPDLTVASLQFMPVSARQPGPYLRLSSSLAAGSPCTIRHDDVTIDPEFNLFEADGAVMAKLMLVGRRVIRGPVLSLDARPDGLSGLAGDVFRPRNLLQSLAEKGWPTEWRCVSSGVGTAAVWQPVCRSSFPVFLADEPQRPHVSGSSLFNLWG